MVSGKSHLESQAAISVTARLTRHCSAMFGVARYANNAALIANILDIGQDVFKGFQPKGNFSYSHGLQPISKAITSKAALNGGNVLGQTPAQGDVICTFPLSKYQNRTLRLVLSTYSHQC